MKIPRKGLFYRWFMSFLIALLGINLSFLPSIALASTGINIPEVNDSFYKPKEASKPENTKEINTENTKVDSKDEIDASRVWSVAKFMLNDFVKEPYAQVEPYVTKPDLDAPPNGLLYSIFVKLPRSAAGNLFFQDGSLGKILIDAWDGTEKAIDVYNKFKTLQQIRELEAQARNVKSLFVFEEIMDKIYTLKNVSKFSKGVGIFGGVISAFDLGFNIYFANKAFSSGDSEAGWTYVAKGVGSFGELLISAGVILGPTPWGVGIAAAGTVLWIGSAIYVHREGIKKAVSGAVNWVKDKGGKALNGVKKAASNIANDAKKLWNKVFG